MSCGSCVRGAVLMNDADVQACDECARRPGGFASDADAAEAVFAAWKLLPKLLAALKKAERGMYYDSENNTPDAVSYDEWYDAMQAVRAAIAKAEGK
jgi:hypothetical protein